MANLTLYVGRDSRGMIVLDSTSMESPAVTIRHTLTPEAAERLADQLYAHADDAETNDRAYAYERACERAEHEAALARDAEDLHLEAALEARRGL